MAMRNYLKNFVLVFFVGLLNQACIKNICAASHSASTDITTQGKDSAIQKIWRIISIIAANTNQPTLSTKMGNILQKEELNTLELNEDTTFANFVKTIKADNLFNLITSGVKVEHKTFVCVKVEEKSQTIAQALKNICNTTVGKLLIVRLLIALKKNFNEDVSSYALYLEEGPRCRVYQHYVKDARVNDNIQKEHDSKQRKTNYSVITLNLDLLKEIRYTLFYTCSTSDSILMSSNLDSSLENVDVALFHEMVHIFHLFTPAEEEGETPLPSRHSIYSAGQDDEGLYNIVSHKLFKYYYEHFINSRSKIKDKAYWCAHLMPWHNLTNEECYRINFEEMLTIAGLPVNETAYQPGDELSENLYRAEKGLQLRFGHKLFTYYESNKIYEKVKLCVQNNLKELGLVYEEKLSKETSRYEQKKACQDKKVLMACVTLL